MADKKKSKKDEVKQAEIQQMMQSQKREQQRKKKQQRLKELAKKSAPLLQYGLIDAYQFFLSHLANSGIPQGNIYEFAAQTMLKFEKNKVLKQQKLKQVEKVNQQAMKIVSQVSTSNSKPKVHREIKPQLLPFKGDLNSHQLQFLDKS